MQSWVENNSLEIETEDEAQSIPKSIGTLTVLRCIFGSKFGNPDYDLWWLMARTNSQAQTGVNFDFEVKFDLEGQSQSTPKTIGILIKVFYTYGPNLVILAWMGIELSHSQTCMVTDHGRTDRRTDAGNDKRVIPQGQNWPWVKMTSHPNSNACFINIQNWRMHPTDQAPVPLTIFQWNSKYDQNFECSNLDYAELIATKFCTQHDSYTVVMCTNFCCDR